MDVNPPARSTSKRSRLPWILAMVAIGCFVAGAVIEDVLGPAGGSMIEDMALLGVFVAFPLFGAFVIGRDARLGWVFLAFGLIGGIGKFGQTYGQIGLVTEPGSLPGAVWGAWITQWWWYPAIVTVMCYLPLLFPDGRLPSRRWRPLAWVLTGSLGAVVVTGMFQEVLESDGYRLDNPVGFLPIEDVETALGPMFLVLAGCAVLSVLSLIVRYRGALPEPRQQIKWFMFAVSFMIGIMLLSDPLNLPEVLFPFSLLVLMAGIATSVLKYRLYDIDVIINRTLVYGLLTSALLGCYLSIVFVLGHLLDPVTGDSDVAIAGSTLAVAALARPLRERVQLFIDLRFYRAKYDARRSVGAFAASLRDETHVDNVSTGIVDVVSRTLQPTHASLWIRP